MHLSENSLRSDCVITNMDPDKEKEVEEEYLSSLMDLNVNSKPLINMLTMLAEDNIEYAPVIVKAVEKHLAKVFIHNRVINDSYLVHISDEPSHQ